MVKLDPNSTPSSNPNNTDWKKGPKITKAQLIAAAKKGEIEISSQNDNYDGSAKLGFGKYRDKTYDWVKKYDKQYYAWALENIPGFRAKAELAKESEDNEF